MGKRGGLTYKTSESAALALAKLLYPDAQPLPNRWSKGFDEVLSRDGSRMEVKGYNLDRDDGHVGHPKWRYHTTNQDGVPPFDLFFTGVFADEYRKVVRAGSKDKLAVMQAATRGVCGIHANPGCHRWSISERRWLASDWEDLTARAQQLWDNGGYEAWRKLAA
jgi:hypothetical protein